jgi:hypothetical protein
MLFAVKYRPSGPRSEEDKRRIRRVFVAWQPPGGVDLKAHYHYVSGGGLVVVDTESAPLLYHSLEAFKPLVAFDIEPVINVIEAIAISMDVEEWSNSVLSDGDL